jgi:hypothetical protein
MMSLLNSRHAILSFRFFRPLNSVHEMIPLAMPLNDLFLDGL